MSGRFEIVNGVVDSSEYQSHLSGTVYRFNGTGLPETNDEWSVDTSTQNTPESAVIARSSTFVGVDIPFIPSGGPDNIPLIASFREPRNLSPCNETIVEEGDGFYRLHTENGHLSLGGGRLSTYGIDRTSTPSGDRELDIGGAYGSIRVVRAESPSGLVIDFDDECEGEDLRVAVACDPEADPPQITFDASLLFDEPETIIDTETDQLYVPTTTPSDEEPAEYIPNPDGGCPDPQPTGDIYWVHRCNSNNRVVDSLFPQGEVAPPTRQTIGYRPGPGLVPGQGFVRIGVAGSGGCVVSIAAQPSTEVMDTEPEVVLTSMPGVCRNQPQAMVDPRPECQPTDAGGGGIAPSSALQDPAMEREYERQQRAFGCSGCSG